MGESQALLARSSQSNGGWDGEGTERERHGCRVAHNAGWSVKTQRKNRPVVRAQREWVAQLLSL